MKTSFLNENKIFERKRDEWKWDFWIKTKVFDETDSMKLNKVFEWK